MVLSNTTRRQLFKRCLKVSMAVSSWNSAHHSSGPKSAKRAVHAACCPLIFCSKSATEPAPFASVDLSKHEHLLLTTRKGHHETTRNIDWDVEALTCSEAMFDEKHNLFCGAAG